MFLRFMIKRLFLSLLLALPIFLYSWGFAWAQISSPAALEVSSTLDGDVVSTDEAGLLQGEPKDPRAGDFTQSTEETLGPLERLLQDQKFGHLFPFNPF